MSNSKQSKYLTLCGYFASKSSKLAENIGAPNVVAQALRQPLTWTLMNGVAGASIGMGLHMFFSNASADNLQSQVVAAGATIAAVLVEKPVQKKLSDSDVGLARGGRVVRASQLASYALPVAMSLGHMALSDQFHMAHDNVESGNTQYELPEPLVALDTQPLQNRQLVKTTL